MKKIKVLLSVALCACAVVFTAACSKAPEDVAVKVMEAFRDGKTSVLNDYCTPDAAMGFGMLSAAAGEELKGTTFKVTSTEIDGDTATVKVTYKKGDDKVKLNYELEKENGRWLISKIAPAK